MSDLRRHYRMVRTVLRKRDLTDPCFIGKFGFSPYQACSHGCLYCDGRAERYYVEGEFDRDIVIRQNAAEVLDRELLRLRERGIVFVGSGISDSYQPPEAEEALMRECAGVLVKHAMPTTILTKSALVRRDLDLWKEVNTRAGFLLMVSLITLDDGIRRTFEPRASSVEERIKVLRDFKAAGCSVGVAAMPLLPFLCDRQEHLDALADRLAEAGVEFVLLGGLTLRPGRQKQVFFDTLKNSRSSLLRDYENLYGENRVSGAPRSDYARLLYRRAASAFKRRSIPILMPHAIYRGRLPLYDELYVLLHHMTELYARSGGALQRLQAASERYGEWLLAQKKVFNRRRRLRALDLEQRLVDLAVSEGLAELLGNSKLASFAREVIVARRTFDYRALELSESV